MGIHYGIYLEPGNMTSGHCVATPRHPDSLADGGVGREYVFPPSTATNFADGSGECGEVETGANVINYCHT